MINSLYNSFYKLNTSHINSDQTISKESVEEKPVHIQSNKNRIAGMKALSSSIYSAMPYMISSRPAAPDIKSMLVQPLGFDINQTQKEINDLLKKIADEPNLLKKETLVDYEKQLTKLIDGYKSYAFITNDKNSPLRAVSELRNFFTAFIEFCENERDNIEIINANENSSNTDALANTDEKAENVDILNINSNDDELNDFIIIKKDNQDTTTIYEEKIDEFFVVKDIKIREDIFKRHIQNFCQNTINTPCNNIEEQNKTLIESITKEIINNISNNKKDNIKRRNNVTKHFQDLLTDARGKHVDTVSQQLTLENGLQIEERATPLDLTLANDYLVALDEKTDSNHFAKQIKYINGIGQGIRPSTKKVEEHAQAATINGHKHAILQTDNAKAELSTLGAFLRSGAFATHGRKAKKMGIRQLKEKLEKLQQGDSSEEKQLKKLGFEKDGKADIEALKQEIQDRTVLTTAQALPVIYAALEMNCNNLVGLANAIKTGNFLFVEQSLLSDLDKAESAMIGDMDATLQNIENKVKIKFVDNPKHKFQLDQDDNITLFLDKQKLVDAENLADFKCEKENLNLYKAGEPLGIQTTLMTMGVNEWQSAGQSTGYIPHLQNQINETGLNKLYQYAKRVDPQIFPREEIEKLCTIAGEESKSFTLIMAVADIARKLGFTESVCCKSGKDRTGCFITALLVDSVKKRYADHLKSEEKLTHALLSGISLGITRNNTGTQGFAFNNAQTATFPTGFPTPDASLFGNAET
jgi:hypothetical protein